MEIKNRQDSIYLANLPHFESDTSREDFKIEIAKMFYGPNMFDIDSKDVLGKNHWFNDFVDIELQDIAPPLSNAS